MTVLLAIWMLWSTAFGGVLSDGADAFEDGNLDEAIAAWQPAADSGSATGKLLFNLGNAWFRKGDFPRAIAYYRAAQRVMPRDGHVHHNLALGRAELVGAPTPALPSWRWMSIVSTGELSGFGLLMLVFVAIVGRRKPHTDQRLLAGALALGALLIAVAWLGAQSPGVGVVVDRDAIVRDTPRTDGAELARLVPGAEVSVVRSLGDFHLIEDGEGSRGWVTAASLFGL
ncbi:MAG: tetratricopeptide repeat protein [Rhodobacterales bacterium]|nr:tetratricopeptide repeat protein [Rhodobacterales bacterium]